LDLGHSVKATCDARKMFGITLCEENLVWTSDTYVLIGDGEHMNVQR
jgi:hypothetical protein